MNLPSIIDDLLLIVNHGSIPQAHKIRREQLVQWVTNQRALWLSREYNKGRGIKNNEMQTLDNVQLEIVDEANMYAAFNCTIPLLRSTKKLPRSLQLLFSDTIVSIRPHGIVQARINYVSREQAVVSGNGIFNRSHVYAFIYNDYLYIKYGSKANKGNIIKKVNVEGVFENPLAVDIFNNIDDAILLGKAEYPISMQFIEYIKGQILQADVQVLLQMPKDITANDEADA